MARLRDGIGGTLVLDAEGLVKLSKGHPAALARTRTAYLRYAEVVTAATTLTEVLRGGARDAPLHRILNRVKVIAVDAAQARAAGELLGRTGLSGHRCALDALLATVAMTQPRPVILLTSDTDDMTKLTDEPGRPARERVAVVRI
ncbi:MAG TPA: PIN domain-containing protein [Streptosporangiaceae bacterium]|nr:PIN domain-containing protein [Streptosporangiaceae bacterium]